MAIILQGQETVHPPHLPSHRCPLQDLGETEPRKVKSENFQSYVLNFTLTEGFHILTLVSMQRKMPCVDVIWAPTFGKARIYGAFWGDRDVFENHVNFLWSVSQQFSWQIPLRIYTRSQFFLRGKKKSLNGSFLCFGVISEPIAVPFFFICDPYQIFD